MDCWSTPLGMVPPQTHLGCCESSGGVCETGWAQMGALPTWFTLMWPLFHRTSTDTWTHSQSTMTFLKSAGPSNLPLVQKTGQVGCIAPSVFSRMFYICLVHLLSPGFLKLELKSGCPFTEFWFLGSTISYLDEML